MARDSWVKRWWRSIDFVTVTLAIVAVVILLALTMELWVPHYYRLLRMR